MSNFVAKNQKIKKGFTLVELLVVISVIGALSALAVPKFTDATKAAELASFDTNYRIYIQAVQTYIALTGNLPTTMANLDPYVPPELTTTASVKAKPVDASYGIDSANKKFTATWTDARAVARYPGGKREYSMN